jgi:hypothetical protein
MRTWVYVATVVALFVLTTLAAWQQETTGRRAALPESTS